MPDLLADEATLLAGIAFLIVLIFTLTRSVAAFRRYLLQKLGQQTVFDMRRSLYSKVHDLGLDYHGGRRTGDTITRVTSDVKEVRTLLVDSVVEVFSSVLILLGMLVVMFLLNWQLTLLALVTVPFLFLAVSRYRQALIERMRVVRTKEGAITSVVQESITGIRAVKIFGREQEEMDRFQRESEDSLNASVDSSLIEAKFSTVLGVVGGIGTALVVYFGARQVLDGTLTIGQLTVFVAYLGLFLSPSLGAHPPSQPDRQVPRLRGAHYRAAGSRALRKRIPRRRTRAQLRGPHSLRQRPLRLRGRGRGRTEWRGLRGRAR